MKKWEYFSVLLSGLLLLTSLASAAERKLFYEQASGRRTALIIGNSNYNSPNVKSLRNPENDARAMAAVLKEKCGFKVILTLDANLKTMEKAVLKFHKTLTGDRNDVALFYYAGHGLQVDGINYLVPVDADIKEKFQARHQCMSASYILDAMDDSDNALNIVILDACRNNPFRSFRSGSGGGLAQMSAPGGALLAFAAAPGKTADDGPGQNGLYTSVLLKYLSSPGMDLLQVFNQVGHEVMAVSENQQIPWVNHSPLPPFMFSAASTAPQPGPVFTGELKPDLKDDLKKDPAEGKWFVILGSYPRSARSQSEKRLAGLIRSGLSASILNTNDYPNFRDGLWVIAAGPFTSKKKASEYQRKARRVVSDCYVKAGW